MHGQGDHYLGRLRTILTHSYTSRFNHGVGVGVGSGGDVGSTVGVGVGGAVTITETVTCSLPPVGSFVEKVMVAE